MEEPLVTAYPQTTRVVQSNAALRRLRQSRAGTLRFPDAPVEAEQAAAASCPHDMIRLLDKLADEAQARRSLVQDHPSFVKARDPGAAEPDPDTSVAGSEEANDGVTGKLLEAQRVPGNEANAVESHKSFARAQPQIS